MQRAALVLLFLAGCGDSRFGGNADAEVEADGGRERDARSPRRRDSTPCDPGASDEPDPDGVDSNCDGVDGNRSIALFVAGDGDDAGDGSRTAPLATIRAALERASSTGASQILIGAGTYAEAETLVLLDGVGLHGGYVPSDDWSRGDDATEIEGASIAIDAVGLERRTTLSRLTVIAADGALPSGASIALRAADSEALELTDGTALVAGRGGDGDAGGNGIEGTTGGSGLSGSSGSADDQYDYGDGGSSGTNAACPEANGGSGGDGGLYSSFSGDSGSSSAAGAWGGSGGSTSDCSPSSGSSGSSGAAGANGGDGGAGLEVGAFDEARAYVAAHGGAGLDGARGAGGGGGGGSSGQTGFSCVDGAGNGGGGGGAGGCGGAGGGAGGGGGGSFGLVSIRSAIALDGVAITTGDGGIGGAAGAGGAGGRGGSGGSGSSYYSSELGSGGSGGSGGAGGNGGTGGGGGGGPSIGIWIDGAEPTLNDVTFMLGAGGAGGASPLNAGAAGLREEVHRVPAE